MSERPIVEIGFCHVDEILPEGWEIIQQSVTDKFPADVNRGSPFPELYLCVKQASPDENVPKEDPITGVCIIFPQRPESIPPGFERVSRTFANEDANLNPGSPKKECYLCFTRNNNSSPITNLQIFNRTMERRCPPPWRRVELTPEGHRANLNKGKPEADEIYLVYTGGDTTSCFGFPQIRKKGAELGLLKVTLISAINLRPSDIGGSCDTYVDMFVSYGVTEKSVSKICRVPVAEKTSNPKWEQTAIFKASSADSINIFFYNINHLKDDLAGVLKFPLDTLVLGKPVRGWYALQMAPQGHALVIIEALDFGLNSSILDHSIVQIDVGKSGKKIRKFKTTERPIRPTLTEMSSQVVSSLRYNGQKKILGLLDDLVSTQVEKEKEKEKEDIGTTGITDSVSRDNLTSILDNPGVIPSEKKGFLEKLGPSGSSKKVKQSKRWFILKDGLLYCFKSPKEKNAIETFILRDAKVSREDLHLIVRNSRTRWDLYASTPTDAEQWVIAIKNHDSPLTLSDPGHELPSY